MDEKIFLIQSVYDHKALTAMSRALRKTVRRWPSFALRVFQGLCFFLLAVFQILLAVMGAFIFDFGEFLILLVTALLLALILGEDQLNGWIANFHMLPGSRESQTRFTDTGYVCTNEAAVTEFPYDRIGTVCELEDYFVFFLGKRHGQLYPKSGFLEGTPDDFRVFIMEKTGKEILYVK